MWNFPRNYRRCSRSFPSSNTDGRPPISSSSSSLSLEDGASRPWDQDSHAHPRGAIVDLVMQDNPVAVGIVGLFLDFSKWPEHQWLVVDAWLIMFNDFCCDVVMLFF